VKNLFVRSLLAFSVVSLSVAVSATGLVGCAEEDEKTADAANSGEDDLKNTEKDGKSSSQWIYTGVMPKLEQPTIDASLKAHTVRLSGLLPAGFNAPLPFYMRPTIEGDRTRVTVVYPIATGHLDPSTGKAPAAPGTYNGLTVSLYPPTTASAPWGGFPFAAYHTGRGIAFHGPITSVYNPTVGDYEWQLIRGPVSHGCNRMQGEHVVEMIHAIGGNMRVPHKSSDRIDTDFPVHILTDFDSFEGKFVDVDYPAQAAVKRPAPGERILFPTWDSRDFPGIVCAYNKTRPLDDNHCADQGAARRDILTGALLNEPAPQGPFVGSVCTSDADCAFASGGKNGFCLSTGAAQYCSLPCEGYCPDKSGFAGTFCATNAAGTAGSCEPKAESRNQDCASLKGTTPKLTARFVGKSTATAAEATVCQ
jgi:hypothetical protein